MASDEIDFLKAVRLCAFGAVKNHDADYLLRMIFRSISKEYHIPLNQVEEMPLEEVLQHWFEAKYEAMDDDEREEEEKKLRETPEERVKREAAEKASEDDDEDFLREERQKVAKAKAKRPARNLDDRLDPDERPVLVPVMGESQNLPPSFQDVVSKLDDKLRTVPPDIKMTFISDDEMESLSTWDVLGDPKDK